jgi:hypothetical protein
MTSKANDFRLCDGNFLIERGPDHWIVGEDFMPTVREAVAAYCERAQARMASPDVTPEEVNDFCRTLWACLCMEATFASSPIERAMARQALDNPELRSIQERSLEIARRLLAKQQEIA